jgi:hypothetical protein
MEAIISGVSFLNQSEREIVERLRKDLQDIGCLQAILLVLLGEHLLDECGRP